MNSSEVFKRVMAGELLLVGEYRGGQAVRSDYVDKKSGLRNSRLLVVYAVQCSLGGCFPVVKVSGNAPEGATQPEQVTIPLQKGKRYAFSIQSVSKDRDLLTAWIGKCEPVLIEDE